MLRIISMFYVQTIPYHGTSLYATKFIDLLVSSVNLALRAIVVRRNMVDHSIDASSAIATDTPTVAKLNLEHVFATTTLLVIPASDALEDIMAMR